MPPPSEWHMTRPLHESHLSHCHRNASSAASAIDGAPGAPVPVPWKPIAQLFPRPDCSTSAHLGCTRSSPKLLTTPRTTLGSVSTSTRRARPRSSKSQRFGGFSAAASRQKALPISLPA